MTDTLVAADIGGQYTRLRLRLVEGEPTNGGIALYYGFSKETDYSRDGLILRLRVRHMINWMFSDEVHRDCIVVGYNKCCGVYELDVCNDVLKRNNLSSWIV